MEYTGLEKLILLQIGDIHYPEFKDKRDVDCKDTGMPTAFADTIAPPILQNAIRSIMDIPYKIDGVLFCGDLTSYGHLDGYKECISYLNSSLGIADSKSEWKEHQVHVVPGNHDVDYLNDNCDRTGKNLFEKFDLLNDAWLEHEFPCFCNENCRSTEIESALNHKAKIYSINSCLGCGIKRNFPESVQKALEDVIKDLKGRNETEEAFKLTGEIIDTPAFAQSIFSEVCGEINSLNDTVMPIIVTHHNILPQVTPRINLYTELLNGGLFRDHLTNCNKSIIYCHGHIHDNPIEIVTNPKGSLNKLICLSAPQLVKGFNVIIIEYNKNGKALGCRVLPYESQRGNTYRRSTEQKIPLHGRKAHCHICDNEVSTLAEILPKERKRFKEILSTSRNHLERKIQAKTLADLLLEAEWLGLVEISNNHNDIDSMQLYPLEDWHIARI